MIHLNTKTTYKDTVMKIRKITSMTMLISFILLVITSIILYIVPHGRVAYWSDWHLWGMSKTQWGDLHINLGFLFLFAGLLHIFYNWSFLVTYMKNRSRQVKIFTPSFTVAMVLTLIVGVGTYFQIPPLSSVINLGESIKDAASEKYGEPPYGHAELSSLKLLCKKQNIDLKQAMELLQLAGIKFSSSGETLATMATANKTTPQKIYQIMLPASKETSPGITATFPESPVPGFGNKTLGSVCTDYGLDCSAIREGLKKGGITAKDGMTIKEIGSSSGKEPMAIFEAIYELVNEKV